MEPVAVVMPSSSSRMLPSAGVWPPPANPEPSEQAYEALRHGAELVHDGFAALVGRLPVTASETAQESQHAPQSEQAQQRAEALEDQPDEELDPDGALERELTRLRSIAVAYKAYRRHIKVVREQDEEQARAEVGAALTEVLTAMRAALDDTEPETSDNAYAGLERAMETVSRDFGDALRRFGVVPMEVMGLPFDVDRHEAVGKVPAPDTAPETVIYEVRRGYTCNDVVLRYAQVMVAA